MGFLELRICYQLCMILLSHNTYLEETSRCNGVFFMENSYINKNHKIFESMEKI